MCAELLYRTPGGKLHCLECDGPLLYEADDGTTIRLSGRNRQHHYEGKERSKRQQSVAPPVAKPVGDHRFFFLSPDAPGWLVDAVYRAFSRRYHPDLGVSDEIEMTEINDRYDRIRDPRIPAQEGPDA